MEGEALSEPLFPREMLVWEPHPGHREDGVRWFCVLATTEDDLVGVVYGATSEQARARADAIAGLGEMEDLLADVDQFWANPGAWGDYASLTSAAGAFAPIAHRARALLARLRGAREPRT